LFHKSGIDRGGYPLAGVVSKHRLDNFQPDITTIVHLIKPI